MPIVQPFGKITNEAVAILLVESKFKRIETPTVLTDLFGHTSHTLNINVAIQKSHTCFKARLSGIEISCPAEIDADSMIVEYRGAVSL